MAEVEVSIPDVLVLIPLIPPWYEVELQMAGPAEQVVLWRHVSTVIWKFSAISKTVRQRSVEQTVQKLLAIVC